MKALVTFLTTAVATVVLLDAISPCVWADEIGSQSGIQTGTFAPVATAAILPSNPSIFPPVQPAIGQLSGSEFVAAAGAEHRVNHDARWRRQWAISLAPLFASQALDAASSYGKRELNPVLAGSNGGFGMKATGIKFGVVGALVGAESFIVKKHPTAAKFFTIVNWVTAGATTSLAVHNFGLR
ncbi:MAG: hypothetical protein ABI833_00545 [Acidobacteriota bacterium]